MRGALARKGWEFTSQIGVSGFRIDLGASRGHAGAWLAGVECDGARYHSSATARDRDRIRQAVLEGAQAGRSCASGRRTGSARPRRPLKRIDVDPDGLWDGLATQEQCDLPVGPGNCRGPHVAFRAWMAARCATFAMARLPISSTGTPFSRIAVAEDGELELARLAGVARLSKDGRASGRLPGMAKGSMTGEGQRED